MPAEQGAVGCRATLPYDGITRIRFEGFLSP
jgi:hypothetical protein